MAGNLDRRENSSLCEVTRRSTAVEMPAVHVSPTRHSNRGGRCSGSGLVANQPYAEKSEALVLWIAALSPDKTARELASSLS